MCPKLEAAAPSDNEGEQCLWRRNLKYPHLLSICVLAFIDMRVAAYCAPIRLFGLVFIEISVGVVLIPFVYTFMSIAPRKQYIKDTSCLYVVHWIQRASLL
jgi:hypothetical protein